MIYCNTHKSVDLKKIQPPELSSYRLEPKMSQPMTSKDSKESTKKLLPSLVTEYLSSNENQEYDQRGEFVSTPQTARLATE